MRPTVTEQIREIRNILERVVAPVVTDDHASEVLRSLMGNLGMLETAWSQVLPFLHWDNARTAELLAQLQPGLDAGLSGEIGAALSVPVVHPLEVDDVARKNAELRDLLSRSLGNGADGDSRFAAVREHLLERASRYPMRSILPTPKKPATGAS